MATSPLASGSSRPFPRPRRLHFPGRILGFSLVGGSVMLGGMLLLFILVQFLRIEQHIAYLIQAVASIETNFLLNRFINWKDRRGNICAQWLKFHSTSAITFPLNQGLFALLSWLGFPYLLISVIGVGLAAIVNYFANDRFVFRQKQVFFKSPARQSAFAYSGVSLPHVGVIIPVRNAQSTIRQCLSALLAQQYVGRMSIFLIGNIPEQDTTWEAVKDFLPDPRIHAIQIQRPFFWKGRDTNLKRYYGCEAALAAGADVLAFTDSQVIVTDTWISAAVSFLLQQRVDGVAGSSCRRPDDHSFPAIYQEASLFSEWPRYGTGFFLSRQNFHRARGLPVTNNLIITRQAWEQVRKKIPLKITYSWEDFRLAWALVCAGCVLYCTDDVFIYRNHRPRFRFAKHVAAGAGALTFYREQPECTYVKRMLWKAYIAALSPLILIVIVCCALFLHQGLLLLPLGMGIELVLLILVTLSAMKANDIRGLLFPFLDMLHIDLWIFGVFAVEWGEEDADAAFADLLVQLR